MFLKNLNIYFFFLVLLSVSVGAYILFSPYISSIFVAALFAVMFYDVYEFFTKILGGRRRIASAVTCILVAVVIVLPIVGVGIMVAGEISSVIGYINSDSSWYQNILPNLIDKVKDFKYGEILVSNIDIESTKEAVMKIANNIGGAIGPIVKKTYTSIVGGAIWIFVMFFSLFYFFIDGKRFVDRIKYLSPLRDKHEDMLIDRFVSMTRATLKSTFLIGGIQGILGGLAFFIAGVYSPILWTVLMIFLSIIPALGASLIIIPAGVIMFLMGNIWQGLFLLFMGFFVSTIDNFLRPKFVGNDTKMHSLLIFFATIGGMSVFGIIGFILGPIIMALCVAMWDIFAIEFKDQIEKFNA